MPILHAVILGIVQGLSEFLPISSSGHLIIVPWLFGWSDFANNVAAEKAFDTALHLGTLIAVLFYLRRELNLYIRAGVLAVFDPTKRSSSEGRLAWLFVISSLPAAVVGAIGDEWITERLGKPWLIACSLIVFGVILLWADKRVGTRDVVTIRGRDAAIIGAAQILALNPGTSRSGITITAARQQGFSRDAAARVSFLMGVPVIAGAVAYKLLKLISDGMPDGLLVPMIVGIVASGISGWLAMWGMIRMLRTRSFAPFVAYRLVVGLAILVILATNFR
ncbi:MAG: undecaprenyl-diphosphate phosphatase [Ilumatobacteraceae bacterium]